MVSSLSLLFNRNMIFRLKNGSSRQLFLIPQSYTWRRNLHVESPVLQLIYSNFQSLCIVCYCFPNICFFFMTHFTFQISGSQFLWKFPKLDHLALWIYWFYLNNFDIFASFITTFISSRFSNVFKIWYESRRCQFSKQIFWLSQRQYEIRIFIYGPWMLDLEVLHWKYIYLLHVLNICILVKTVLIRLNG